jgi:flagellin
MSFSVVTNIASANASANLYAARLGLDKAMGRLSSGYRINSSGDDSAGLAVANKYRNDQAILNQGIRNANDGLSKLQIKDGALANIATLLDRMATLATQAATDASDADITKLSSEYASIITEIDREAAVAGLTAQTGFSVFISSEATAANGKVAGTLGAVEVADLGFTQIDMTDVTTAAAALVQVRAAIATLGNVQNSIGTLQNRLQFAIGLAQSQVVNTMAAESRIRDANVAAESANMTKYNILTQSGIAALAQANQSNSSVLALLR